MEVDWRTEACWAASSTTAELNEEDDIVLNCSYILDGLAKEGPSIQLDASRKEGLQ